MSRRKSEGKIVNRRPKIAVAGWLLLACSADVGAAPLEVGHQHQLFVDDHVIAERSGITLTLHQPVKCKQNPVLRAEKPWESGSVAIYGTVFYDEQDECFKMWYRAIDDTCYACYATSKDGVHWDKPILNVKPHKGSTKNNIVLGSVKPKFYLDGFAVIKEPNEPDPKRRYKMLTYNGGRRFAAMISPDGIHWSGPINPKAHDTGDVVSMYYDTGLGKYVALLKRRWVFKDDQGKTQKRRARLVSYSNDFVKWATPTWAIVPDEKDPPETHIYSHVATMYEGMRIGYISVFRKDTERVDVQLCSSRDGKIWQRYRERIPFIPAGPSGSFDSGSLYANASGLIRRDGKIWIYYCGYSTDHAGRQVGDGRPKNGIGLAHLRVDGFVSADAGKEGGTLLTRPMICAGSSLHINATAPKGRIRAEVLDSESRPIQGFEMDSSVPFWGDSLDAPLRWKSNEAKLPKCKPVRVRFHLANAELYSFWWEE